MESYQNEGYRFVNDLWKDEQYRVLDVVGKLVYRSNILGSDGRITNTGGGNTSSKLQEIDPLIGESVEVLWVKGSGGDLRTSKRENFSSLYMDKLLSLIDKYNAAQTKGVKTPIEDEMVAMYPHATFGLNPHPSSIDTPLHAFINAKYVDHTHPNAAISVAASKNAEKLTREIYGDDVVWTSWQRPGFDLGLVMRDVQSENPQARGIMLGQHGLINWADDEKECYYLSLDLIERAARFIQSHDKGAQTFGGQKVQPLPEEKRREIFAEILPWLRGQVSQQKRFVGTIQDDNRVLEFICSHDAARLAGMGTSCPDHFLRTKIKPLFVDWNPQTDDVASLRQKIAAGIVAYRDDYKTYYENCKHADSPAMRDANPTVILVPGLGMIAWGKDKSESRVTAEFYSCAIEVMRGSEAIDEYIKLPQQEAFDIEYWNLEEAKLQRMPPEKELARQVVVVVGAGSGIGREVALRICGEGAHVVCIDLKQESAQATADEVVAKVGAGIGVAGSGISGCGAAIGLAADITDRESVRLALQQAVLAYGGVDAIVVTAGVFFAPDAEGYLPTEKWATTFAINVTGSYIVVDEAAKILREQGLPANVVLTTSANAVVSKKGSLAYDTSKAAANHLVRELAVELAPLARVNGVAPATVVQGSTMFPRERVLSSLAKYEIEYSNDEDDDALRAKLANFYAQRTLTKVPIVPADQAEAFFLLLTNRLSKTTGQIIPVDGGLVEAFLR